MCFMFPLVWYTCTYLFYFWYVVNILYKTLDITYHIVFKTFFAFFYCMLFVLFSFIKLYIYTYIYDSCFIFNLCSKYIYIYMCIFPSRWCLLHAKYTFNNHGEVLLCVCFQEYFLQRCVFLALSSSNLSCVTSCQIFWNAEGPRNNDVP